MSVKPSTLKTVDDLIERYPALEDCKADLVAAVEAICESYRGGPMAFS
jgi:D-sedoheptulose 7-phosphate isomerase